MTWDEYRDFCLSVAQYPKHGTHSMPELSYLCLGLGGETGEALDVVKKAVRKGAVGLGAEERQKLTDELGDVLWYLTMMVWWLDIDMENVMKLNHLKLTKSRRGEDRRMMNNEDFYEITREISIDAGHRIPLHESKCRNIHGHRYKILLTVMGRKLKTTGSGSGMLMDFGFMKEEMMGHIDAIFDHALILYQKDPLIKHLLPIGDRTPTLGQHGGKFGKIVIIDRIPTAENLAELWTKQLIVPVASRSEGWCTVKSVTVFETPNCSATFTRDLNQLEELR